MLSLYHLLHHTKHTPLYVSPVTWGNRPLLLSSDGNSGVIFFGPYSYRLPPPPALWNFGLVKYCLHLSFCQLRKYYTESFRKLSRGLEKVSQHLIIFHFRIFNIVRHFSTEEFIDAICNDHLGTMFTLQGSCSHM